MDTSVQMTKGDSEKPPLCLASPSPEMPSLQWVCTRQDPLMLDFCIPECLSSHVLLLPPCHVVRKEMESLISQNFLCIRIGVFLHVAVNRPFRATWNSKLATWCITHLQGLESVPLLVMLQWQWFSPVLPSWNFPPDCHLSVLATS